jgi:iron complex outermembrane receptor protein
MMTTNDRYAVPAQQLTVSAHIHRVLRRAGLSLVTAATFASALAYGQSTDTSSQQVPEGAPKQGVPAKVPANASKPITLASTEPAVQTPGEGMPPAEEPNGETGGTIQEVTITGSRIQRTDGFSAPTPVAVMDSDILKQMSTTTIAESLTRMPQFSSNLSSSNLSSNVGTGTAGANLVDLRGLGANRTLVLFDGKRMISASLGTGGNAGAVDTNVIPSDLIERVEVVTGGASAAYGSDALAGVVNFITNNKFTGVRTNIEGGSSFLGDDVNYKATLTAGTGFADNRGHVIFSGELTQDNGVTSSDRSWADPNWQFMTNPAYVKGNGLPQFIVTPNASLANGTLGGLITTCVVNGKSLSVAQSIQTGGCPLRGVQFLQGGAPTPFTFGALSPTSPGPVMVGGTVSRVDQTTQIDLPLARRNVYGRVSFDVTDDTNVYTELSYSHTYSHNTSVVPNLNNGGQTILSGNPYIPASVQSTMTADGVSAFTLGSFNGDMGYLQGINQRDMKRAIVGSEGKFHLLNDDWKWEAYAGYDEMDITSKTPGDEISSNWDVATHAIVGPSGAIICDPTYFATATAAAKAKGSAAPQAGCVPYNPMGLGVNTQAALAYVTGYGDSYTALRQYQAAADLNGEPFSTWAAPVSIAAGVEWRKEAVDGEVTALDQQSAFFAGNYKATVGQYHVTEGFLETTVPLAKNLPFAESADINAGVRETDYSTSGSVTTWKVGATWTPIKDIRFRATRSLDIRAPNLGELFNTGVVGTGNTFDPGAPGGGQTYFLKSVSSGSTSLQPERAYTTGFGFVFEPRFLPGYTLSVDYYNIQVRNAVSSLATTTILQQCFSAGKFCNLIDRDPTTGLVDLLTNQPQNITGQQEEGIDINTNYSLALPKGELKLYGLANFVQKLKIQDPINGVLDGRGVINPNVTNLASLGAINAPRFSYLASMTYSLDPVSVSLIMTGVSAGVFYNGLIVCNAGCPTGNGVTTGTSNDNHIDSYKSFSLSANYMIGKWGELYGVVDNLFDKDPPVVPGSFGAGFYQGQSNINYDRIGRAFHLGWRAKF